jgi:hypothetical protein
MNPNNPKLVIQLSSTPEGLSCATWYDDLGNAHGPGIGKGPFAALDDLYRRLGCGVGQLPRSKAVPVKASEVSVSRTLSEARTGTPVLVSVTRKRWDIIDETAKQPEDEATKMAREALDRAFGGAK